ncbi:RnfABCDGE type electron transport complex subunit B [Candidatus Woesearchaeota archaeon]|nr:RnfABCDGE type electron transport complex subunit B [Candidatus Woesearchaeota archaeon]
MDIILASILTLGSMGIIFGIILAIASQKLAVKADPKIDEIVKILPGLNCGGCGHPSCQAYAEAIMKGEAISLCKPGGKKTLDHLTEITGETAQSSEPMVATRYCNGGCNEAKEKYEYTGVKTCKVAALLNSGYKQCTYSCLGFGDCAKVCPTDAITMNDDMLPIIDKEKCIGCEKCVIECPKNILLMAPKKKRVHVRCTSLNPGKTVVKVCSVGCIACNKCERECPFDAIHVKDNIAIIDYDKCTNCQKCVKVCPRKIITVDQVQESQQQVHT